MDIKAQYEDLLPEIKQLVGDVIDSGRFILGPNVRALEEEVAASVGYGHAVAVANGTDALELGLQALGIGPGDEVVTTAYTFFATAEAIARRGATPVFADIDPVSLCLDPDAAEAAITERTRAVMPVHIFGQTADLRAFRELADRHGIALIEDAAQAFGATFEGYRAGSYGDVATFSFFPTKNFPAMGDAGMAIASSEEIAEKVRLLRFHGSRDKKVFEQIGVNSRLDEMQAVILRRFLPEVDGWNEGRVAAAARYSDLGLGEHVSLPEVAPGRSHIYHLYVVRTPAREQLQRRLKEAGVASAVYYGRPHHLQPVFRHLGYREGSLPVTEAASRDGLALPMFPTLAEEQQREVVNAVRGAASAAA
jgi:dTDP-4-amino-4,6-dideoxygalactose transaminase